MDGGLKPFSIGIVAEDKQGNIIKVFPIEHLSSLTGSLTETESVGSVKRGKVLEAVWLGESNRITAPDVKKGETVRVYKYAETDKYYWSDMFNELDLRGKETVLYLFGNTDKPGEELKQDNSHWMLWDAVNKSVKLHTSNNDGEAVGFDVQFNLKTGVFNLLDTEGNEIKLTSLEGELLLDINTLLKAIAPKIILEASEEILLDTPQTTCTGKLRTDGDISTTNLTTDKGVDVNGHDHTTIKIGSPTTNPNT